MGAETSVDRAEEASGEEAACPEPGRVACRPDACSVQTAESAHTEAAVSRERFTLILSVTVAWIH
jgi:hypothetical protein